MKTDLIKIDVDQIKEEDLQRAWKEAEYLQWKGPESSPLPWLDVRPVRDERCNFANKFATLLTLGQRCEHHGSRLIAALTAEKPDRGSDH